MQNKLMVKTHGIDQNILKANGSYEPIDWGNLSPDELLNLLQNVKDLSPFEDSETQDICAPNVMVENRLLNLRFENLGFALIDDQLCFMDVDKDIQCEITPFEAVSLATGQIDAYQIKEKKTEEIQKTNINSQPPSEIRENTTIDNEANLKTQPLRRKRGALKIIALIIGIFIISIGAFGAILGEVAGGVIIMVFGALPALYGFIKPGATANRTSANKDELYYQQFGHDFQDDNSDNSDTDFDFD